MRQARSLTLACLLATVAVLPGAAAAPPRARSTVAVLPVQDRAGDQRAVMEVERALLEQIAQFADLVDPTSTRDLLRGLRVRNVNIEPPDRLRELARALDADWLLSVIVHDAERRGAPGLTLSARAYRGASGELHWVSFDGGSGLDTRTVLGLGEILDLDRLAPGVVRRSVAKLEEAMRRPVLETAPGATLVAIVPFDGLAAGRPTATAEAVTEGVRSAVHRLGLSQVPPGCTSEVLRAQRARSWGGLDAATRRGLRLVCGAELVLTGAVERYERTGAEFDPEPIVAIAIRVVDADTGRILWTDALERGGWDGQGLFRIGRVHSVGALVEETTLKLARRLQKSRALRARLNEERE